MRQVKSFNNASQMTKSTRYDSKYDPDSLWRDRRCFREQCFWLAYRKFAHELWIQNIHLCSVALSSSVRFTPSPKMHVRFRHYQQAHTSPNSNAWNVRRKVLPIYSRAAALHGEEAGEADDEEVERTDHCWGDKADQETEPSAIRSHLLEFDHCQGLKTWLASDR